MGFPVCRGCKTSGDSPARRSACRSSREICRSEALGGYSPDAVFFGKKAQNKTKDLVARHRHLPSVESQTGDDRHVRDRKKQQRTLLFQGGAGGALSRIRS